MSQVFCFVKTFLISVHQFLDLKYYDDISYCSYSLLFTISLDLGDNGSAWPHVDLEFAQHLSKASRQVAEQRLHLVLLGEC